MPFLTKDEVQATAYLIGITIGAGVIALPYVFGKVGFFLGAAELLVCWLIVLSLTLCLGEVVLRTKAYGELPVLAEKYLGKKGKRVTEAVTMLYIYGALIAYGIGLGEAMHGLFGFNTLVSSGIFYLLLAAIVYLGLKTVTRAEVLLTPFIFVIIIGIVFFAVRHISWEEYFNINTGNIFLPLGSLFFALLGVWCVPDMKRILKNKKSLRKTIVLGTTIPAILYLVLTAVVVGVTGEETTEVFGVGLTQYINPMMCKIVFIFIIFTISTSFLGVGFTLQEMFQEEYKKKKWQSWLAAFFVPFLFLFFLKTGFAEVITITGALATVVLVAIILLLFYKAKRKGDRKPEYVLAVPKFVGFLIFLFSLLIAIMTVLKYL